VGNFGNFLEFEKFGLVRGGPCPVGQRGVALWGFMGFFELGVYEIYFLLGVYGIDNNTGNVYTEGWETWPTAKARKKCRLGKRTKLYFQIPYFTHSILSRYFYLNFFEFPGGAGRHRVSKFEILFLRIFGVKVPTFWVRDFFLGKIILEYRV
jgi:hypothetical protein